MHALEALINAYQSATQGWLPAAVEIGNALFRRLAALELVVFGLAVAVKARGPRAAEILPELVWKLFLIALLMTGLLLYPLWVPSLIPSFAEAAGEMTGFSTLNPGLVLYQGISLGVLVLATATSSGWMFPDLLGVFVGGLTALGIILAFIAIAAIMTKTLIESWIVLAAGPLFLGFAPFRLTATLADNFLVYAFQVGIKLFFLLVLMAAASEVATQWAVMLQTAPVYNLELVFQLLAGAILLAVALWSIPTRLAEALTRNWQLGLQRSLGE